MISLDVQSLSETMFFKHAAAYRHQLVIPVLGNSRFVQIDCLDTLHNGSDQKQLFLCL